MPTEVLTTNAPQHWPRVRAPRRFLERRDQDYNDRFAAGVRTALEKHGLKVVEEGRRRLVQDGVFEVPWIVLDGDREVPVFLLPRAHADECARFHGARRLLKAMRAPTPVFYAARPLANVPAADPCGPWRPEDLTLIDGRPKGTFAMWWATPQDRDYLESPARRAVRRIYRALDGRESYFYARLLRAFGGKDVELERAPLPREEKAVKLPVRGPDGHDLYVTASRQKGIRFHFDKDRTPAAYRDAFLTQVARFAEGLRDEVVRAGGHKDSYYEDRPLRWLEALEEGLSSTVREASPQERLVGAHIVD